MPSIFQLEKRQIRFGLTLVCVFGSLFAHEQNNLKSLVWTLFDQTLQDDGWQCNQVVNWWIRVSDCSGKNVSETWVDRSIDLCDLYTGKSIRALLCFASQCLSQYVLVFSIMLLCSEVFGCLTLRLP